MKRKRKIDGHSGLETKRSTQILVGNEMDINSHCNITKISWKMHITKKPGEGEDTLGILTRYWSVLVWGLGSTPDSSFLLLYTR